MTSERGRGVVLHALTVLILLAGGTWWWRAEPRADSDPRLLTWRLAAEQLLPDAGDQEGADNLALAAGAVHEEIADLDGGSFLVSVVCAGPDGSRVRVAFGDSEGQDSGRGLNCSGDRTPEVFSVGVAQRLRMGITVEVGGPVVFRYTLQRDDQN
ncbi:DUF6023 family protein [Actinoplanes sp. NPDC051851]|uniref:DUF6023 family protein n=1 Tax=Actinoplanes sp. NPDC051851 TaxID=3154753 RepID=UPI003419F8ED